MYLLKNADQLLLDQSPEPILYDERVRGWFCGTTLYTDPDRLFTAEKSLETLAAEARTQRNQLLKDSDWTQVADAPVDQAAWAAYRQALRDIPAQPDFPHNIVWPVAP